MPEDKKSRYNENKNRYTQQYIHEHYQQVVVRLLPEEKQELESRAADRGLSVNQYIKDKCLKPE